MNSIASAIAELSKLVGVWIQSAPSRNMKNAIKNGEKYINVNEDMTITKDGKAKLLERYKHRFDKYKLG